MPHCLQGMETIVVAAVLLLAGLTDCSAYAPAPAPSSQGGAAAPVLFPAPDAGYTIPPYAAGVNEGTAGNIIQKTDIVFTLTGRDAVPFQQDKQTLFSNQLRAMLANYNFMSVALSDYQVSKDGSSTSVTGRLALADSAEAVTRIYEALAWGFNTSPALVATLQQDLAATGMSVNVTLSSVSGVPLSAAPTQADLVTLMMNMTLAGPKTVPFNTVAQSSTLRPWSNFFGNHLQSINLNTSEEDPINNLVNVSMQLTILATELPDMWWFLFNTSEYQAALASSIDPAVTATYTGSSVLNTAALAPSFAAAAAAPAAAPGAQLALNGQAAANASASPFSPSTQLVTMDITMRILGSSIIPFDQKAQVAAATAMAGVFSIVIGSGNVQVLSSTPVGGSSAGRKLLQTASIGGASGSGPVGEDVAFATTLPEASQNSLLVLQSQNGNVRQQFSNWFTGQMQAEGYNVTTGVQSVTVGSAGQGSSSPSSGSPGSSTTSSSGSGGGGTNVGAIVGGVVGGVVGLAIIALLLALLLLRGRKHRQGMDKPMISKWVSESTTSGGFSSADDSAMEREGRDKMDAIVEQQHGLVSTEFNPMYTMSSTDGINTGILTTGGLQDSGHQEEIRRLLGRKRRRTQAVTDTAEHDAETALMAISDLRPGTIFRERFQMDSGMHRGGASIVTFARQIAEPFAPVVIKFFPDHRHFQHEKLFYENRMALEVETASECVPCMFESVAAGTSAFMGADTLPPCIVLERGAYSLQDWLESGNMPSDSERLRVLHDACKAVEFLHVRNIVHRQLSLANLTYFPRQQRWKLIDFSAWARSGEDVPLHYALRYAAPELLVADLHGVGELAADDKTDMWALGVMAFEVLTGRRLFGSKHSDEDIIAMLLGYSRLPWETDPMFFANCLKSQHRGFVQDLLRRSPEARRPIRTAMLAPMFAGHGGTDTGYSNMSAIMTGGSEDA